MKALERVLTEVGRLENLRARGRGGRSVEDVARAVYAADVEALVASGAAIDCVLGVEDAAAEIEKQRDITKHWIRLLEENQNKA